MLGRRHAVLATPAAVLATALLAVLAPACASGAADEDAAAVPGTVVVTDAGVATSQGDPADAGASQPDAASSPDAGGPSPALPSPGPASPDASPDASPSDSAAPKAAPPDAEPPEVGPCAPTTCAAQGKNCGPISDGCGGTLECGTCTTGLCGAGGTVNVCGGCGSVLPALSIAPGASVLSCDGRFALTVDAADGNLVLYMGATGLWNAGVSGNPGARATMGVDGNFTVTSAAGDTLWGTGTGGNTGASISVQNDGNLVVYDDFSTMLWSSGTCCH